MKSKFFILIAALLLLTSCSGSIGAERFFAMNFYEAEVIPATTYLQRGEIAAVEFYAAEPFSGIEVLAAKVAEDDTLTVTLYEFNTDYATTLKKGKKVESATFRDYESRDTLILSFKTADSGKYLLTFTTKNNAGICVATYPSEQAKNNVKFYLYGEEYTVGAFYSAVLFNGNRLDKNYFQNISTPVEPTHDVPTENDEPTETPEIDPENSEEPTEIPDDTEENPMDLPGYVPEYGN